MADVYKVGVSIAMSSNAAQVLGAIGKEMLGLNLRAKELEGGFNRIKLAAAGLGAVIGGVAVLSGMVKLVEHGKEFVHQQSLMAQAGLSHIDIATATASAWKTAGDVIGSSAEKNIALVADLRNRLGSMSEAVQAMPAMAKLGVFLQNGTGQDQEKAGDTAARFLELRGALVDPVTHQISESRLEQQARLLEAIAIGTRFKVGPDQLLGFQSYARASGSTLSDEGLVHLAPVIGAAKSASTVGTQLSSLEQQLLGGVMTKAAASWLGGLHLLDGKKVHEGKGGHLTLDPGALIDGDLLRSDPVSWIEKYIGGALLKKGETNANQQVADVISSHLRSTVTGFIAEVLRSYPAFAKDAANITAAQGTDQYQVGQATDPTAKINAFRTAWQNLLTSLGAPIVSDATGLLTGLTKSITGLTIWASSHPTTVVRIEELTAGLAALSIVGGTVAITAAALGPLATGLRLLSVATIGLPATSVGLVGVSTGLGLLAKSIPLVGVALAAWFAGQWIHDNTPAGKIIDNSPLVKQITNKIISLYHSGDVPQFATPEQAARSARFHERGGFSPLPYVGGGIPSPYTPTYGSPRTQATNDQYVDLHTHVYVGDDKLSETVERKLLRNMRSGVQTGSNNFDMLSSLLPAGSR